MSDNQITIEIDGKSLTATRGQMLIEVTDANNIYVPRFCYHKKLSVAANCRMCLVDVEKAPKPLPACATPVMEGMVVKTRSAMALEAQKSVMEFLLINHPLDCPICDQGGECELQDLAMGYGSDVSRYHESKRVVKDRNIGPLVQTDLTRCIHCTRCVRFGEEIAGLRELGATGRGENMQIGTYVEKSMRSELSGNVIDLCPVGALTSKPFRFSARAWEMQQRSGIAPHDCIGSNVELHIHNNKVLRVVPAENEAINEVWLSDRDRFSYEGLYSEDRLLQPMVKSNGSWQTVEWDEALNAVVHGLNRVRQSHGNEQIGALVSPSSTCEEYYLLQKLIRGMGSGNIDHRLRQSDFSFQELEGPFPWLGQNISDLENNDAFLIIGANPRQEVPMINHRIRKASLKGSSIMVINPQAHEFNYDLASHIVCQPPAIAHNVLAVIKAALTVVGKSPDANESAILDSIEVNDQHRLMASALCNSDSGTLLLGEFVGAHPERSLIKSLAVRLADITGSNIGYLTEGANSAGAWLTGVVPHRDAFGKSPVNTGMNVREMIDSKLAACVLYNIEPEHDCIDDEAAVSALQSSEFVVAFSAYATDLLESVADVLLPIALFAENEGSYVNVEGRIQTFHQAVKPAAEIKPGWRVLRKMGNQFELPGFEYQVIGDIQAEILPAMESISASNGETAQLPRTLTNAVHSYEGIKSRHMYAIDPLVRRGQALGETGMHRG